MTRPQPERLIARLNDLLDHMERTGVEPFRPTGGEPNTPADEARRLAAALLADLRDTPACPADEAAEVDEALRRMFRIGVFSAPPLSDTPYDAWRRLHETTPHRPAGDSPAFMNQAGQTSPQPLASEEEGILSLLMPVYNPCPDFLDAALKSVRSQTDPHWELCVADDASTDERVKSILLRHMAEDARIRVAFRERNGHISAASNTALELARGEWCGLVDHDDVLSPQAVALVRETLAAHPEAAVLFTDEDRLETPPHGATRRASPFFKPGFDPDLLLACNAVSHFGVYRTSLLRRLGGFRQGMEGAQDHDLALRCLLAAGPGAFIHLPHVLYHWRMHEDSTSRAISAKPYARDASLAARQAFAAERNAAVPPGNDAPAPGRIRQEASIHMTMRPNSGFADIRFRLPAPAPLVTLIIAPWDALPASACPGDAPGEEAGRRAADAIATAEETAGKVVLLLKKLSRAKREVLLLVPEGEGWRAHARVLQRAVSRLDGGAEVRMLAAPGDLSPAEAANLAVSLARGAIVGLIRAGDLPLRPDWAHAVAAACWRNEVAAAGCRGVTERGFLEHAGYAVGHGPRADAGSGLWLCPAYAGLHTASGGYYSHAHLLHSVPALPLAGLFCRTDVWRELGGLDPAAGALASADFCLRAWRDGKRRSVVVPGADLLTETALRPQPVSGEFARRWEQVLDHAPPFQSRHLSWAPGGWRFRPR